MDNYSSRGPKTKEWEAVERAIRGETCGMQSWDSGETVNTPPRTMGASGRAATSVPSRSPSAPGAASANDLRLSALMQAAQMRRTARLAAWLREARTAAQLLFGSSLGFPQPSDRGDLVAGSPAFASAAKLPTIRAAVHAVADEHRASSAGGSGHARPPECGK